MKYCSNCGGHNDDENKWCISCGSKLDQMEGQQPKPIQPESQQPVYAEEIPEIAKPEAEEEKTEAPEEVKKDEGQAEYERAITESVEKVYNGEIQPEPISQAVYEPQPDEQKPEETYYGGPQETASYRNPVVDLVKQAGTSRLFLAAVILFTVSVGIGIISALVGSDMIDMSQYVQYYRYLDIDTSSLLEIMSRMSTVYRLFSLVGQIPSILIAVGLWMFYIACRDKETNFVAAGGLNMIKVVNIVMFILACIGLAVAIIAMIFAGAAIGATADYLGAETGLVVFIFAFVLVILIIAAVLIVFYYLKLFKTINTIKFSATTGQPSDKISIFLIVMNFLSAFFTVTSLAYSVTYFFTGAATIAFLIIINILLIKYRSEMKQIMQQNE